MISFTFEVISRDPFQTNLYNLFSSSVVDSNAAVRYENVVKEEEEGRLDLFCKRIYGNSAYIEELMVMNNIMNPFSIKQGDILYYVKLNDMSYFNKVETDQDKLTTAIKVGNKSTRIDPTRQTGVPPTIRPLDFEQVIVDTKNQTIKINPKLS